MTATSPQWHDPADRRGHDEARDRALAWLARQLSWEATLEHLRARAERGAGPAADEAARPAGGEHRAA